MCFIRKFWIQADNDRIRVQPLRYKKPEPGTDTTLKKPGSDPRRIFPTNLKNFGCNHGSEQSIRIRISVWEIRPV